MFVSRSTLCVSVARVCVCFGGSLTTSLYLERSIIVCMDSLVYASALLLEQLVFK